MAQHRNSTARFTDVDQEPTKDLLPIKGYQDKPLVSLRESVIRVQEKLHNMDTMLTVALRNSRDAPEDLSVDESAAIRLYTMEWNKPYPSLYKLLNENLRSEKRENLTEWFSYLKLFLTALYKLPSYKGTIWRGIPKDLSAEYNKDDRIRWGISSCSLDRTKAEKFAGSGERTLFQIECLRGKVIEEHSQFPGECEVILMPGMYFRIISNTKFTEDLVIIHMRESTTPPYQTIAPPFVSTESPADSLPLSDRFPSLQATGASSSTVTPENRLREYSLLLSSCF